MLPQFTERETLDLLTGGNGIGPVAAKKIHDVFGARSVYCVESDPDVVVEHTGIPEKVINAGTALVRQVNREHGELAPLFVKLKSLFKGLGFSHDLPERLLNAEGEGAYLLATERPFALLEFNGAGLNSCDKLFQKLGGKTDDAVRIAAFINHRIDNKSSTWFEASELADIVRDMGCRDVSASIQLMLDAGNLVQSGNLFTKPAFDKWETSIAESVTRLLACDNWPTIPNFANLTDEQNAAIQTATSSSIGILCGGAGTGKTTCVAEVVRRLRQARLDVALVASTGAAACRVQSVVGTMVAASTVHRFLGGYTTGSGEWKFRFDADNPLECDVVLVDETSMLDLEVSAALLSAIDATTTAILLIGDDYQLPSVGKGFVFRDLIASGVPVGRLTTTHRNAGAIAETSAAIRNRKRFATPRYDGSPIADLDSNFYCVPAKDEQLENAIGAIHERLFEHGFQSCDIQTISGTNKVRYGLNPYLRKLHNSAGKPISCTDYYVGDRIVYTGRNTRSDAGVFVPKGQQAVIESDETDGVVLRLLGRNTVLVAIDRESLRKTWELAYAITVHKSQGNEWPATIVIGSERDRNFDFSWCYTALTRAQQFCFVLGNVAAVQRVATNEHTTTARTRLFEKIGGDQ